MARSSIYGNAIMPPKWAFGGEFGDLSQIMNQRDQSYENVAQEEIVTDSANLKLEDDQRKERMREILQENTATSRPATIRDAYQQMIDAAYDAGDPIAAMDYETKRQAYEDSQLSKRRSELTGAITVADNLDYDRLNEYYPGVLSRDDYNKNQKRKKAGDIKSSDMVVVMNTETGAKDRIPWSMAAKAQQLGWEVEPSTTRQQEIFDKIEQKSEELANPPSPGIGKTIKDFLNPTAPVPRPSPTPAPQDARGDRARQLPKVGDEVKVIKRERNVKGK